MRGGSSLIAQLILLVLNAANSCSSCVIRFIAISNYLRVLIFVILLSFAEIAEINTREMCHLKVQATHPRACACILHATLGLMLYLLHTIIQTMRIKHASHEPV